MPDDTCAAFVSFSYNRAPLHTRPPLCRSHLVQDRTRYGIRRAPDRQICRVYVYVSLRRCCLLVPSVPVLSALGEALVKIRSNDALVELGAADVLHAVQCILVCVVLDKAEPAGSLLEAVKAHD